MSRTIIVLLVALAIFSTGTSANLICNRKNEEFQCGSACQTTCENLNIPCPIVNIRCNNGCYCKKGFARRGGDDGPCIPINKCPKRHGKSC